MKSFLGLASYFRDHIHGYTELTKALQDSCTPYKKPNKIKWNDELTLAFVTLQEAIGHCPMLFFMDGTSPIFLHTDASNFGIGAYLFQLVNGKERPVAFLSKTLNKTQIRWSTIEKETYAIVYALSKLGYLIRDTHFTLRTDHKNLTFANLDHREKVKRWKIAMQEFDFDIEHIEGEKNIAADHFSRLCKLPEADPTNLKEVAFINLMSNEIDLKTYKLSQETYDKIKLVHNPDIGHFGLEKTKAKLIANKQIWKGMTKDIKTFIRRCPCCQKMSFLKVPIETQPFTLASYSVMDRIAIDAIGPLPTAESDGYKYIIVIIDAFSRYVKLIPAKDTSASEAQRALLEWVGTFGLPSQIISDNGTQFANETITELLSLFETEHIKINAYSKEENAIVERANKEVNRHLRAMVYHKKQKKNWYRFLPLVQRIINAQVHRSIGVSPNQIIFGNTIDNDRGLSAPFNEVTPSTKTYQQLSADLLLAQADYLQAAQVSQWELDEFHIAQRIGDNETTEFPINSYVLVHYEGEGHLPPSKLHTKLKGPMRVVSHNGNVYTLENLNTNKLEDYYVKLLRPFYYDPLFVEPRKVAQHDDDYHDIEQVLSHRFKDPNKKERKTMSLLIKWSDASQPSWHEWSVDYGRSQVVIDYFRTHGLKQFIHARFKTPANNEP
jgi:hypothetical protein